MLAHPCESLCHHLLDVKVKAELLQKTIKAPITKGQQCGTVSVTVSGQVAAQQPLIALQDDPKGGFWRHFFDWIFYVFHKIF